MAARPGYQGPDVSTEFLADIVKLLDRYGKSFQQLEGRLQREISGNAAEIARIGRDVQVGRGTHQERFGAWVDHHRGSGDYSGNFRDAQTAKAFGNLVRAMVIRDSSLFSETDKAALGGSTGEAGGYLIADDLASTILRDVETYGSFEQLIPPTPCGLGEFKQPARGSGAVTYFPEEGAAPDESQLTFTMHTIKPKRWSTLVVVDNSMLMGELAVALADYVVSELLYSLGYTEDLIGWTGDGSAAHNRTIGSFTRAASDGVYSVVADAGDNTFQEVIDESSIYLAKVLGLAKTWVMQANPVWLMHHSVFFGYMGARDSSGKPIANIFLMPQGAQMSLFGYPVKWISIAPKLTDSAASTTLALFGVPQRAWSFRRVRQVLVKQLNEIYALKSRTAFLLDVFQHMSEVTPAGLIQLRTAAT